MDEKEKKNKKTIIRRILIGCAVVAGTTLIAVGAYAGFLANKTDNTLKKIAIDPKKTEQQKQIEKVPDLTEEDKRLLKPMTMLLAGIDSRDGSGGTINTDVMMLASFNPDTHSASIVSIPRDMRIESESGAAHKANYFYAHHYLKDKDTAIEKTKEFFSDLFEVPIDYMVMIDFDGLRQIVDEVGGLDVEVDMDMRYVDTADGTDIDLKKGMQHLDGKKTLDFVRYRKSNRGTAESTDPARNHRQQVVLNQVMDKLASFEGVTQWSNVLDIVGNNVKTDIPVENLRNWIYNFRQLKPQKLTFLPLESDWKSPYMIVDKDQLIDAFAKIREEVGRDPEKKKLSDRIGTYTGSLN